MITENINAIKSRISAQVCLVAVSKFKTISDIQEAYEAGQLDFGENYVQELLSKTEQLPPDIRWHFIGHLQTNKVKYVIPHVHLIHSVDSEKLLAEINKQAQKINKKIDVLLQIHIASETTKEGLAIEEFETIIMNIEKYTFINVRGLMGMASFSNDNELLNKEFALLKSIFDSYLKINKPNLRFEILSMGMSGDYDLAIKKGSNMIRVGTAIFGKR